MGLVKTRRLAAMQKQQCAEFGVMPPVKNGVCALPPHLYKFGGKSMVDLPRTFHAVFGIIYGKG